MIFVTVGSQKFQFNRLLQYVDELIEEGIIEEEVIAQVGYSDYVPKNYEYTQFLTQEEFKKNMEKASIVITHGGTGAIITALRNKKKVIAIPRLSEFGEHVDDHQLEIVTVFSKKNYILEVVDIIQLREALNNIYISDLSRFVSNSEKFLSNLAFLLEENL